MNEIGRIEAEDLARKAVQEVSQNAGVGCELLPNETIAAKDGWLFFYQSSSFLKTGNVSDRLAGNGPLLVRHNGSVEMLPSIPSISDSS